MAAPGERSLCQFPRMEIRMEMLRYQLRIIEEGYISSATSFDSNIFNISLGAT